MSRLQPFLDTKVLDGQKLNPWTDHRLLGISLGVPQNGVKDRVGGAPEFSDGGGGGSGIDLGARCRAW